MPTYNHKLKTKILSTNLPFMLQKKYFSKRHYETSIEKWETIKLIFFFNAIQLIFRLTLMSSVNSDKCNIPAQFPSATDLA